MIAQRVMDAFELFANSEVKLISKQCGLEGALAKMVLAAECKGCSDEVRLARIDDALSALDVALRECE